MLFLGSSWNEVGVEGSVDALRVHRLLPDVVYERIHSIVEGLAWAEGASNVLLTDTVSSSSALLVVEAQHSHVHGGELKVITFALAARGELVCIVVLAILEKERGMPELEGLAQGVMVLLVAARLGIFTRSQEVVEAHGR